MAVMTKEQLAQAAPAGGQAPALPFTMPLPKDRYSARIKACTFGQSKSSGNNMLTVDVELYHPQEITHPLNGKTYTVGGLESKMYLSLQSSVLGRLLGENGEEGIMEKLGLKPEIDPENPDTKQFENKCFSAVFGSEKREQRKELTAAEIAAGKKFGDPILNEDGSPSISYAVKYVGDLTATKHVFKNPF